MSSDKENYSFPQVRKWLHHPFPLVCHWFFTKKKNGLKIHFHHAYRLFKFLPCSVKRGLNAFAKSMEPCRSILGSSSLIFLFMSSCPPGSVFTNYSLEHSLSYSPNLSIFRSIWKLHNFWLAKLYGLANQKLCYIPIWKF